MEAAQDTFVQHAKKRCSYKKLGDHQKNGDGRGY